MMKKMTQTSALPAREANIVIQSYLPAGSLVITLMLATAAHAAERYTITDLGTLGGSISVGMAVNASGQVTGLSQTADGKYHAFVTRTNGQMTDLGTLGGSTSSGLDINDSGQVTGEAETSDGKNYAFITNGSGQIVKLNIFNANSSSGTGINSSGQVTGKADGFSFTTNVNGQTISLGDRSSYANAINDIGQVTGWVTNGSSSSAFITHGGKEMYDLGLGANSAGAGINASGQVAGGFKPGSNFHAFVTNTSGNVTDLRTLGGGDSYGKGINSIGQVVGYSQDSSGSYKAFVTDKGIMKDLNTLLVSTATDWKLEAAYGINDAGQMTGYGFHNGIQRGCKKICVNCL